MIIGIYDYEQFFFGNLLGSLCHITRYFFKDILWLGDSTPLPPPVTLACKAQNQCLY